MAESQVCVGVGAVMASRQFMTERRLVMPHPREPSHSPSSADQRTFCNDVHTTGSSPPLGFRENPCRNDILGFLQTSAVRWFHSPSCRTAFGFGDSCTLSTAMKMVQKHGGLPFVCEIIGLGLQQVGKLNVWPPSHNPRAICVLRAHAAISRIASRM